MTKNARPSTPITRIVGGNTVYSDNFKLDYLTGGWVVVDRDKMITELEAELKKERKSVLDELEQKIKKKILPKNQQWEDGMYIQYNDVLRMIESLISKGEQ